MPELKGPIEKVGGMEDPKIYQKYIADRRRVVPLTEFVWDHRLQYGQLRKLNLTIVNYYVQSLMTNGPPDLPFTAWTKQTEGVSQTQLSCWLIRE